MNSPHGLLIDNVWQGARSGATLPVYSPVSEEQIGTIPDASPEDADAVLASAARGFEAWRAVPAWERGRLLRRAADIIRERREEIARMLSGANITDEARAQAGKLLEAA